MESGGRTTCSPLEPMTSIAPRGLLIAGGEYSWWLALLLVARSSVLLDKFATTASEPAFGILLLNANLRLGAETALASSIFSFNDLIA